MSLIPKSGFPTYSSQDVSTRELHDLLHTILGETGATAACIFEPGSDYNDPFIIASTIPLGEDEQQRLYRFMREHADTVRSTNGTKPPSLVLDSEQLERTPFQTAVLFPLTTAERHLGVLVVFYEKENLYTPDVAQKMVLPLQTISLILENNY